MTKIIEELLRPIVRSFIEDRAHSLFLKAANWLDANLASRTAKIVIGMLLGLMAFFAIPVVSGLLGF
jgi:hypothetical protein